jgi:hypothetical protein
MFLSEYVTHLKELGLVLDKPEARTHESEIELLLKSGKTTALLMAVNTITVVFFGVMFMIK